MESVDSYFQHRYRKRFFRFDVPYSQLCSGWSVLGQSAVSPAEQLQCRANRLVYPNTRSHISENPPILNTAERAPLSCYLASSHFLISYYPLCEESRLIRIVGQSWCAGARNSRCLLLISLADFRTPWLHWSASNCTHFNFSESISTTRQMATGAH
jgi:hypothetical protein